MSLRKYNQKRDFTKTSEPAGKLPSAKKKKKEPIASYVIHKHAATRLHYDLRLEVDGVLKSWAVPKGPSLNPADKRLAVEVEDHPLDYGSFEGTIPKGEYGGGNVIIWDRGKFLADDPQKQLQKGKLEFALQGEKLAGTFVLLRLPQKESGKNNWLLIKSPDTYAKKTGDITKSKPQSVVSGYTVEEISEVKTMKRRKA